jgi:hypothetical protein
VIDTTSKSGYNRGDPHGMCSSGWLFLIRGMEMQEAIFTAAKIPVLTRLPAQDPFLMRPQLLTRV